MAAITDPQIIKFVNEEVRPLAEKLRALMVEITDIETVWFSGLNGKTLNDSTPLEDKRDAEGVSRLTGSDVNSLISVAIAMRDAGNTQIISKPCVRALTVG